MSIIISPHIEIDKRTDTRTEDQSNINPEQQSLIDQSSEYTNTKYKSDNVNHIGKLWKHTYFDMLHANVVVQGTDDFNITR